MKKHQDQEAKQKAAVKLSSGHPCIPIQPPHPPTSSDISHTPSLRLFTGLRSTTEPTYLRWQKLRATLRGLLACVQTF